jgi:hypothetical protein
MKRQKKPKRRLPLPPKPPKVEPDKKKAERKKLCRKGLRPSDIDLDT